MKLSLPLLAIMMGALLASGCATKKYVRQTVDPVSGKLDQVAAKTDQQGQQINQTNTSLNETRSTLEKDETQLNATNERAVAADKRAGEAMDKANDAATQAATANQGVQNLSSTLNSTIANLDAYKPVAQTTVNFKFNSDKLDSEAKMALDQMVANQSQYKRYYISVEGFTDHTGSVDYNAALSRRRADNVVAYLVAEHNIPVYRIQMVGLGKEKPVDEGTGRAANAKNRRVEVTLFSADQNLALNNAPPAPSTQPAQTPNQ